MRRAGLVIICFAAVLAAQSVALIPVWNGSRYEWWTIHRLANAIAPLLPTPARTRYQEQTFALTAPQSSFGVPGSTTWAAKSDVCIYQNGVHQKHEDYGVTNSGGSLTIVLIPAVPTAAGHEFVVRFPVE